MFELAEELTNAAVRPCAEGADGTRGKPARTAKSTALMTWRSDKGRRFERRGEKWKLTGR